MVCCPDQRLYLWNRLYKKAALIEEPDSYPGILDVLRDDPGILDVSYKDNQPQMWKEIDGKFKLVMLRTVQDTPEAHCWYDEHPWLGDVTKRFPRLSISGPWGGQPTGVAKAILLSHGKSAYLVEYNKNYYLWSATTDEVCRVNEPTDLSEIVSVLRDPNIKDRELNITYYIEGSRFEDNSWVTFGLDAYGARFPSESYGLPPGTAFRIDCNKTKVLMTCGDQNYLWNRTWNELFCIDEPRTSKDIVKILPKNPRLFKDPSGRIKCTKVQAVLPIECPQGE